MIKIDDFLYDITPTSKGEIVLIFKVDGKKCEMKIPKKDLQSMLWFANNG